MVFPAEFGGHVDKGVLVLFTDVSAVPPGPGGAARLDPGRFGSFRKKVPVRFRSQGRDDVVPDQAVQVVVHQDDPPGHLCGRGGGKAFRILEIYRPACAVLKGEFNAAPLPVEIGGFLDEGEASARQFRRNRHGADMAAGIAGVFLELGYSGRRPDSLAGTQCGSGVLGPQDGFFREGKRRFFFPDVQHGRFLHVFRPLVAEGDSVVENAGAEAEAGIIPGNHVFVKMDGSGGVFAARFKGVADVVLHFFHAPSRNASGKVLAVHHDAQAGGLQNRLLLPLQGVCGFSVPDVQTPCDQAVRGRQGGGRFSRQDGSGHGQPGDAAENNQVLHHISF